jgi:hypothetical protein
MRVDPAGDIAKTIAIDGGELIKHHASPGPVDLDLRAEWPPRRARGRRRNDPGGQRGQRIGLEHHGVARALVLMARRIARCPQPVDVTTHARCPVLHGSPGPLPGHRDREPPPRQRPAAGCCTALGTRPISPSGLHPMYLSHLQSARRAPGPPRRQYVRSALSYNYCSACLYYMPRASGERGLPDCCRRRGEGPADQRG